MKSITQVLKLYSPALAALMIIGATAEAQTLDGPPVFPAQTPATPQPPGTDKLQRRPQRRTNPAARVTVMPSEAEVSPQVVTIIHRLSGIQMLRLLLRQGERGTVAAMDPRALADNAHATIIAGWLMPDGKTIVARLPQAAAEIESADFQFSPEALKATTPEAAEAAVARAAVAAAKIEPDLTVVTGKGRRLRARYIGLDGPTGLSILQVSALDPDDLDQTTNVKLSEGEQVQLFAPEPATPSGEALPGVTYVRVAKTDAKIAKIARSRSGVVDRVILRSPKLSTDLVGGIVCDTSGNNVGIIERIEGVEAQVVTADNVQAASRRVLDRQTNVPRPLLGVRGEPVGFTNRNEWLSHGWNEQQINDFVNKQVGILLTSVLPGTPAAFANLRAGDVIVKVNDDDVKTAEEFSSQLMKCGSGQEVKFLVRRPTSPSPVSVDVKLGGSFEPFFEYRFEMPRIATPKSAFQKLGLETMALTRKSAMQLGAQSGLLVVSVKPRSAAARAGMKERDVIESIDGRTIREGTLFKESTVDHQKKHIVSVIRDGEKKQLILEPVEE